MSNTLIQRVTLTTFLVGALALTATTADAQTTTARRGIRVTKDGGRTEATSGGEVTSSRPATTPSTAPTTAAAPSTNSLSGSTSATTSPATSTAPSTTSGVTGSVTSPSSPSATSSPTSSPTTSSSTVDTAGLRSSSALAPSTNSGSTANPTAGTTLRDTTNASASTAAPTPPAPSMDKSSMPGMGNMTMDVSSWTDANVIAHLASGDSMEVQLANLAQTRAQRADVRDFAATLARDHQQNLTQLLALAPQTGFAPSPAANDSSAMHAQMGMTTLTSLQGTAFDSAFVAAQVMHHQMDLTMLQQLRGRAQSAQLRTLIDQTIPVIQAHLDRARALAAR